MDLLQNLVLVVGREEGGAEHRDAEERHVLDDLQNTANPVADRGQRFHGDSIGA
jgi:hypothetical protein